MTTRPYPTPRAPALLVTALAPLPPPALRARTVARSQTSEGCCAIHLGSVEDATRSPTARAPSGGHWRARRACPATLWPAVTRKLTQINRVRELRELAIPPGNRQEALRGTRRGQHSIRINDQFRICFRWEDGYADDVEVTDYH